MILRLLQVIRQQSSAVVEVTADDELSQEDLFDILDRADAMQESAQAARRLELRAAIAGAPTGPALQMAAGAEPPAQVAVGASAGEM